MSMNRRGFFTAMGALGASAVLPSTSPVISRATWKTLNFGLSYGMGPDAFLRYAYHDAAATKELYERMRGLERRGRLMLPIDYKTTRAA